MSELEITNNIVARGVARLYFESGVPLAATAAELAKDGLSVSWLNVARQMQQQGFSRERVLSEFRELEAFRPGEADPNEIALFCAMGDEAQKEMLWAFWSRHTTAEELLGIG